MPISSAQSPVKREQCTFRRQSADFDYRHIVRVDAPGVPAGIYAVEWYGVDPDWAAIEEQAWRKLKTSEDYEARANDPSM